MRKKVFALALLALLLFICIPIPVQANTPFTVYGYISDYSASLKNGISVKVTNANQANSIWTNSRQGTTKAGFFQINLGNMPSEWHRGDKIFVNASYLDYPQFYYGHAVGVIGAEGYMLQINVSTIYSNAMIMTGNFKLYTPVDIYQHCTGVILMRLLDRSLWTPLSNRSSNISCYIQYPNGTMFVDGKHPTETAPGVYIYTFAADGLGIYRCWATCAYDANCTMMDSGLFTVKWDTYDNMSRLYERIGNVIYLFHWENNNLTNQIAYRLNIQNYMIQNVTRIAERTDFVGELRQTAMEQAFGVLFWTIALTAFSIISTVFFTRRKKRMDMFAVTSAPQEFITEMVRAKRRKK